ncbi:MAG: hypothetical protein ACQERI_07510 [Candidatus Krumholzibacteriota bacterium]
MEGNERGFENVLLYKHSAYCESAGRKGYLGKGNLVDFPEIGEDPG